MITLQANNFDLLNIQSELDLKVGGIKELTNPKVLEELANAVFTITGKAFIKAMNIEAKANPKKYHHIYEWNRVGTTAGRLFFLYNESSTNGMLVIKPGFIKSKVRVPIDPALLEPGKTGKIVSSRYVFRDKATIMESGKPVIYRASKNTPIPNGGQLRFIASGTLIKNYNPGGKQVKGSFEQFYKNWYATKVNSAISSSKLLDSIDNEIAKVLSNKKAGPAQVRTAIINLLKQYSKGQEVI